MDETFVFGEIEDGFDHHMDFFSSVTTSEWQVSETDSGDIHVKNTSNLAIGASLADDISTPDDDLLTSESAAVRSTASDTGKIRARQNFLSGTLCEYDAVNPTVDCFSPSLIGGQLQDVAGTYQTSAAGIGMSCNDEFLVGIQNGQAVCSSDVVLTCPAGEFMVGVNSDGELICNVEPIGCEETDVTSWCGETLTLPETYDGGYALTYSGECYEITDYDSAYFTTATEGLSYSDIGNLVETINNEPRTQIACNVPDNYNSQIRETYQCTSGSFNHVVAHEKRLPWIYISSNIISMTGSHIAEPNDYPYEAYGGPLTPSDGGHDCWCREDYGVSQGSCGDNYTGNATIISKHRCPQNVLQFAEVFRNEENCTCQAGTDVQYQSCWSYYNDVNGTDIGSGDLSGTVELTYGVTCDSNTPVVGATPLLVDTSDCACTPSGPYADHIYCPTGKTNSFAWTWPGLGTNPVVGVEDVRIDEYVCPGTITGGLPDPGSWVSTYYNPIPACTCDSDLKDIEIIPCEPGLEGVGKVYEKEWDCAANGGLGDWEPQSDWTLLDDKCNSCSWQKPSGTPEFSEFALGSLVGSICSCGTDPAPLCRDYATGGYDVWNNCQCVVQAD